MGELPFADPTPCTGSEDDREGAAIPAAMLTQSQQYWQGWGAYPGVDFSIFPTVLWDVAAAWDPPGPDNTEHGFNSCSSTAFHRCISGVWSALWVDTHGQPMMLWAFQLRSD